MGLSILPMDLTHCRSVSRIIQNCFNRFDRDAARQEIFLTLKCEKFGLRYNQRFWVACVDKRVVGFIGIEYAADMWISWFAVDKKFQGMGFGKTLFEHFLHEAAKTKAKRINIECGSLPRFKKVNSMYKRYGFKEVFRIPNYWPKGDHLIVMSKRI